MQRLLAGIYDVPLTLDVCDFLVTERAAVLAHGAPSPADEQLLVVHDGSALRVALYIDAAVLEHLERESPTAALTARNVADCWTALEGVSHFVYLAWNAHHDRSVSRLELELQAEVDKYMVSWWLLRAQDPRRPPLELHRALFERAHVDTVLAAGHASLYATANRYAARFCRRMEADLNRGRSAARARVAELRRFYRFGTQRKLSHIERYA